MVTRTRVAELHLFTPRGARVRSIVSPSAAALVLTALLVTRADAAPLVTLTHHVAGARLDVGPEELWVPKNIPGSLTVDVVTADGARAPGLAALTWGTHVEAVLRGPAFPALRVLGLPNEPLLLPPIALVGEYQLDDVRLVRTETNEILMMGTPSSIPIHVFPEVLVSAVTSRPLSAAEIQARGIDLDAESFSAVEFQVMFQLESELVPVHFPVVTPRARSSLDYLPLAEREALLVEADLVNRRLASEVVLPRGLQVPGLGVQVTPINFQAVDPDAEEEPIAGPHIPGLVVIPGGIGFLDRFFSIQVFTANASPAGSGITVHDLQAELLLPPGRDSLPGTGDEPLILPRIDGAPAPARAPMTGLGADGQLGTADDPTRLFPGQTAQTELVVQAKREGLHTFDLLITGTLDGLAAGEVAITGHTFGSVLVRNPRFSVVFAHPRTVRAGEPYTASITVLNTSDVPAELVSVHLPSASVSGVTLTSAESVALGTLAPGESRTADFEFTAQLSGHVGMTNLTGDDALTGGRFDFRLGIDERGVALSDATLAYPEWVDALPRELRRAADRVLGQALGVATAATLPPGVRPIALADVDRRVIELAEAGQRLRYGDVLANVLFDLALDWHGGRAPSRGFDQIVGETGAGAGFRHALVGALTPVSAGGRAWLELVATELAARGEPWAVVATEDPAVTPAITRAGLVTGFTPTDAGAVEARQLRESGLYRGTGGWLVPFARPFEEGEPTPEVAVRVPAGLAPSTVTWLVTEGAGRATKVELPATSEPARDVCLFFDPALPTLAIRDLDCDRSTDGTVASIVTEVVESPPRIVSISQDLAVTVGRPDPFCGGPFYERFGRRGYYGNYGTLLAVLFSKVVDQASVERDGAFTLDDGTPSNGVAIQPGGRVALVNLRKGIGDADAGFRAHALVAANVVDRRGAPLAASTHPIDASADQGIRIRGRVLSAAGDPVPNVPVTLTMHDLLARNPTCRAVTRSPSQVRTDDEGRFTFDFVMADVGYTLAAIDDRGVPAGVLELITEATLDGQVDADRVAALAREPGRAAELVAALGTSDLVSAIQRAQTIDRATFTDAVSSGSPRLGSEVPVALRFRGRGTITGTILASDGHPVVA
ncbi:hypothetical protein L6R52_39325, partial [Myxococcota bacterium]|nr:hypothetical protein [Myxococcota bacterium]